MGCSQVMPECPTSRIAISQEATINYNIWSCSCFSISGPKKLKNFQIIGNWKPYKVCGRFHQPILTGEMWQGRCSKVAGGWHPTEQVPEGGRGTLSNQVEAEAELRVWQGFQGGPEFGATRKQPIIPGNSRARSCAGEEHRVTWLDLRPG